MPTINLVSLAISAALYGIGHLAGFLHGKFHAAKNAKSMNVAQQIAKR